MKAEFLKGKKVAIVCDWLTNVGGAEKVLLEIHKLFPKAPIYTSKYDKKGIDWFLDADVRTGWLQIFPSFLRRFLGPFRQIWFSRLDLSEYDLVISVTGAEAKAVKAPNGVHVSYCHVPTQYYWQMYDDYVKNPGFGFLNPVVRFFFKALVRPLRSADFKAAARVDQFVTISEYARGMIKKYYKREAEVVHPVVEVEDFAAGVVENPVENFYVVSSRQVTWKRLDLAVKACLKLKRKLIVIGEGPEHKNLVEMAGGCDLVEFVPLLKKEELAKYLAKAQGYLFPSLEPFGIAPVEALAAGCPVIAFGEGGVRDYVVDGKNGVLFGKQTVKSLAEAMERFEEMKFKRSAVSKSAEGFGRKRFDTELFEILEEAIGEKE
ncbi:MAG: glycosyltransferase [Candidatus Saccharibacteria bacterium]|nr:glycosyltransferase [Candidatus Saccharibacteria bacterium]